MADIDTVSLLTAYKTVAAAFLLVPVAAIFLATIALWLVDLLPKPPPFLQILPFLSKTAGSVASTMKDRQPLRWHFPNF
jgi:hypothetical protein